MVPLPAGGSVRRGRRSILLATTADLSLVLIRGFPEFLVARGWEVHIVSSPGPLLGELGDIPGVFSHPLPMRRQPAPWSDLLSLLRWIRLVRSLRPRVLFIGTPKAGLLGNLAGLLTRVPRRIYLLRGLRLETASGAGRILLAWMERLAAGSSHTVVAVSESLRRLAISEQLVPAGKIVVLGSGSSNGVDIPRFSGASFDAGDSAALRGRIGLDDGVPVIGFVGRLTHDKGIETLVRALGRLNREGVDHQLLLVGGVDDENVERLLTPLNDSGRPPASTGAVKDTSPYYQLMDVLALPTLREGLPNVVLEAAAAGVPTVTTDATGAVDAVIDGVTGVICPVGDAAALADALAGLLADDEKRARLGAAASDFVRENFEQSVVWARLDEFLSAAPAAR